MCLVLFSYVPQSSRGSGYLLFMIAVAVAMAVASAFSKYRNISRTGTLPPPETFSPGATPPDLSSNTRGAMNSPAAGGRLVGQKPRLTGHTCPACDADVYEGMKRCRCGWRLPNMEPKITAAEDGVCPSCKHVLRAGIAKCPFCGWRFDGAPAPSAAKNGKITRDIFIGGGIAFSAGEEITVESVEPDPQRPEYRYVVNSATLAKRLRLSDNDIDFTPGA